MSIKGGYGITRLEASDRPVGLRVARASIEARRFCAILG